MCGIAGIFSTNGSTQSERDRTVVSKMCSLMRHRGPDDEGFYSDSAINLGHRRLSIIDLSRRARQPMSNEDGSLWIVYNGEIYNFRQLREELEARHKFKSNSDTEVILHLYEEKGEKCLEDLRGMFAFAIYDKRKQRLFLARDRVGKKPLVYSIRGSKFYFASEVRALVEGAALPKKINKRAVMYYLLHNFRHVPDPYSIYEGVSKLPPATYMIVDRKGMRLTKYWKPEFKKKRASEEELINAYRRLLEESCSLRMVSDVEVGLMLSGGIDSSTITSEVSRGRKIRSYSMGVSKQDPELERARRVSKLFNTRHKEKIFNPKSLALLPELIHYYGEPLALLPALHSYVLSKEISKDLKVVLSGNGADEIFYGYDGSNEILAISRLMQVSEVVPKQILGILSSILRVLGEEKLSEALNMVTSGIKRAKGDIYRKESKQLLPLFVKEVREELDGEDFGALIDKYTDECDSNEYIDKAYYVGLLLENAHSITIISDLTGMANSLEVRCPFLDHRMIEFAYSLPTNMKIKSLSDRSKNKYIMKKALEGKLPKDLIYSKKMGFGYNIRLGNLLRREWRRFVEKILFRRSLSRMGLFDMTSVERMFDEHMAGEKDNSKILFSLMSLEIWYELFFENRSPKEIESIIS